MPRSARTTYKRPLARLPLAAAIYLAFGSMAWAQEAPPQPQPPPSSDAGQADQQAQPHAAPALLGALISASSPTRGPLSSLTASA